MKCTNRISALVLTSLAVLLLAGCGKQSLTNEYSRKMYSSAFMLTDAAYFESKADTFASDLCVDNTDDYAVGVKLEGAKSCGMFDMSNNKVLFGNNIYDRREPASLTKVMTALVAIKYGNLNDEITVNGNCNVTESGAQKFGIKPGDKLTLDQALNIMLLYSANDVALAIAEHVGGSTEHFCEMMNEEALSLGATNSHFVNPHGLSAEDHYTTAYDLYLILNEAVKYERFKEIVGLNAYTTSYVLASGEIKQVDINNLNQYLTGKKEAPDNITVLGGKTGTTNAAGNCLIIYAKDKGGNPYISVVLGDDTRDNLYVDMNTLLSLGAK